MVEEEITRRIQESLVDAQVVISSPRGDGLHFEACVISDAFIGKTILEQQQQVMQGLSSLFGTGSLHALALKTYTRQGWENREDGTFDSESD